MDGNKPTYSGSLYQEMIKKRRQEFIMKLLELIRARA